MMFILSLKYQSSFWAHSNTECEGLTYLQTRAFKDSIPAARQLYEPKLIAHIGGSLKIIYNASLGLLLVFGNYKKGNGKLGRGFES